MTAQTIVTPAGERLVMLPEAEYEALLAAAEDTTDRAIVEDFRRSMSAGTEELVPAVVVDRILAGESRLRVWREHRELSLPALATRTGLAERLLAEIETGERKGTVDTLRRIADVLSLTLDDLVG